MEGQIKFICLDGEVLAPIDKLASMSNYWDEHQDIESFKVGFPAAPVELVVGHVVDDIEYGLFQKMNLPKIFDIIAIAEYLYLEGFKSRLENNVLARLRLENCFEAMKLATIIKNKKIYEHCVKLIKPDYERFLRWGKSGLTERGGDIIRTSASSTPEDILVHFMKDIGCANFSWA